MQTSSSYPADAIAFSRHRTDLPGADLDLSAYPAVRPLGPTPRTIRAHVGRREFGSVGVLLATVDPTARRLGSLVGRARARDAELVRLRKRERFAAPLIAFHAAAGRRANRALDRAMVGATIALLLWVVAPTALTLIAGAL